MYGYKPNYGDDLKIVNGKMSAEQYPMMPNSRSILMDANCDRFYIKQTDASGISTVRTYEFKEVKEPSTNYITMEQLEEVLRKYELNIKPTESKSISNQQPASQF